MDAVASKFVFTPDQIENAIHDAVELTKWEGRQIIDSDVFHRACRSQLHHELDKRAQRIDAGGDWNRLILPDSSKDTLVEVCSHIKHKIRSWMSGDSNNTLIMERGWRFSLQVLLAQVRPLALVFLLRSLTLNFIRWTCRR